MLFLTTETTIKRTCRVMIRFYFFETFMCKIMEKIKYLYFNTQKLKKFLNVDVIIYGAGKKRKCKNK